MYCKQTGVWISENNHYCLYDDHLKKDRICKVMREADPVEVLMLDSNVCKYVNIEDLKQIHQMNHPVIKYTHWQDNDDDVANMILMYDKVIPVDLDWMMEKVYDKAMIDANEKAESGI